MQTFKNILLEQTVYDLDALDEYLELVSSSDLTDGYTEKHHILPKSLFPEYANEKWNLVTLVYEKHVKSHELLFRIFRTTGMYIAYKSMSGISSELRILVAADLSGDGNPAKRQEVRQKISDSKTGVSRPDMVSKRYFGASEEKITAGLKSMSEKLSGTVIVIDEFGDRIRIRVDDPRYIAGELKSFNSGDTRPNSGSKNPEVMKRVMSSREEKYAKFKEFTFDEMVDFLEQSHISGKNIFGKKQMFSSNFSAYVNRTEFDKSELYNSVVQRLEKGTEK